MKVLCIQDGHHIASGIWYQVYDTGGYTFTSKDTGIPIDYICVKNDLGQKGYYFKYMFMKQCDYRDNQLSELDII